MSGQMRGIYTIPPVVYHDDLTVDCEGTRRAVRFCLDCGSHGIVVPVYASEYFVLSAPERKAVLEAAGSSLDKVVKTTCFLADMNDFAAFNEVYGQYFTEKPARSCVAVKTLPKNVLAEVEAIATE